MGGEGAGDGEEGGGRYLPQGLEEGVGGGIPAMLLDVHDFDQLFHAPEGQSLQEIAAFRNFGLKRNVLIKH